MAHIFSKYADAGALHWREMTSRSLLTFNAHQQARYELALKNLGDIRGKDVVDLGCGDGAFTSLLVRAGGNVTGVENEQKGLDLAKEIYEKKHWKANFILGSVEDVPLPDACADAVTSSEVIEHLDHPDKHIAEAARLLRPGGVLVVTTPYRLSEEPAPFHIHEFYPSELKVLAEPYFKDIQVIESHHILWLALYNYRPKWLLGFHIGRRIINIMTLWFRRNPFLKDASNRKKRDYYSQLTMRAVRK